MASGPVASGSGLFKFLRPGPRLQSTDISAAVTWGVAATTTALWLVQEAKAFYELRSLQLGFDGLSPCALCASRSVSCFGPALYALFCLLRTTPQLASSPPLTDPPTEGQPFDWLKKQFQKSEPEN